MSVTRDDLERAMFVVFPELADQPKSYIQGLTFTDKAEGSMKRIAMALAEERVRARRPFLALAAELDAWRINAVRYATAAQDGTAVVANARASAYERAIGCIRRALDETP